MPPANLDNLFKNAHIFMLVVAGGRGRCGNKQRPSKWKKAKSIYSELPITKESATITYLHLAKSQSRQQNGKLHSREKGRFWMCPGLPVGMGKLKDYPECLVRGAYLAFSTWSKTDS